MIYQAFDTVLHQNHVPVEKITQGIIAKLHVSEQLCFMDRQELIDSFMFDNHAVFYDGVDSVSSTPISSISIRHSPWFLIVASKIFAFLCSLRSFAVRCLWLCFPQLLEGLTERLHWRAQDARPHHAYARILMGDAGVDLGENARL